ncbi:MAG: hypothetical protein M3128_10455 [Verrucomicrobiota bacterium]|nr:hypothetical protein [Verrucomicrobiota bacterium]
MRSLTCWLALLLGLALTAAAQKPRASVAQSPKPMSVAQARPQFRPAVLGTGPDSLVNRINVDDLLSKGQKSGAIQFCAVVAPTGEATSAWTYHSMPNCEALNAEVEKRLDGVKFTPPIYNHQPVGVYLFGTVVFTADVKPHLHIFLNQDPRELKDGHDFIAPQPVMGADSKFTGLHFPPEIPVAVTGLAEIALRIDAKGTLQDMQVTGEDPPLLGFRDAALNDLAAAKFIPAFRSGDPSDSESILSFCYKAVVMEGGEGE